MIERHLSDQILKYSKEYPAIAITGPRQSGKTTLVRHLFPNHTYVSLESPDKRLIAQNDPRFFLTEYGEYLIIDEIQRVPELFSYLQEIIDNDPIPGKYIITGSQQFMLMEGITQSLAGRIVSFSLQPFSFSELVGLSGSSFFFSGKVRRSKGISFSDLCIKGLYPRVHDRNLDPVRWYEEYINTYIEKDVRQLSQVADLNQFHLLLRLLASRAGQLINYASLANDSGISQPTVKRWISLLETSGIVFTLKPYFRNFGKRLIKSPKVFFTDTGVLCSLLSIRDTITLNTHPLYGGIFENFIITEIRKIFLNKSTGHELFFWRDKTGNEIDCLIADGINVIPVEIKAAKTFNTDFIKGINKWMNLKGNDNESAVILYNGDDIASAEDGKVKCIPWQFVM